VYYLNDLPRFKSDEDILEMKNFIMMVKYQNITSSMVGWTL